jgi:hypothetical protein
MQQHQMMVRIPEKLHRAARVKAVSDSVPLSEVVRVFLSGWVDGTITLPQPTEQPPEVKTKRSKT